MCVDFEIVPIFVPILRLYVCKNCMFYLTSCDAETVRCMFMAAGPVQRLWLKHWFLCCWWPWRWPFLFLSHALGMKYWNLHAKFHKNRSSINMWFAADTHTHMYQVYTDGLCNCYNKLYNICVTLALAGSTSHVSNNISTVCSFLNIP